MVERRVVERRVVERRVVERRVVERRVVERPPRVWAVAGSIPCRVIQNTYIMI